MRNPGDDLGCFIGPIENKFDGSSDSAERTTDVGKEAAISVAECEAEFLQTLRDLRRKEDFGGWPTWVKQSWPSDETGVHRDDAWSQGWAKFSPKFDFGSDACINALTNKKVNVPAFRISVSRNIRSFELPGHMTSIQRIEFEEFMNRSRRKQIAPLFDRAKKLLAIETCL